MVTINTGFLNSLNAATFMQAGALSHAFTTAVENQGIQREAILADMGHVKEALVETNFSADKAGTLLNRTTTALGIGIDPQRVRKEEIRAEAQRVNSEAVVELLDSIAADTLKNTAEILTKKGLLQGADRFASPEAAKTRAEEALGAGGKTGTGLRQKIVAPAYEVAFDGVTRKQPEVRVTIAEVIKDVTKRVPIGVSEEIQDKAFSNMDDAIHTYFAGGVDNVEHSVLLTGHMLAVIEGSLGAPAEVLDAILNYVAQSPEHAEAYGQKVEADALLGEVFYSPLPVVVDLEGLKPRKVPVEAKEEAAARLGSAQPVRASLDNILNIAHWLYLLNCFDAPEIAALRKENPAAFGSAKIRELVSIANIVDYARHIDDPVARAVYLYGIVPDSFMKDRPDPKVIKVKMPARSPAAQRFDWVQPIASHMASQEYLDNVKGYLEENGFVFDRTCFTEGCQNIIRQDRSYGFSLRTLLGAEFNKGSKEVARAGLINARLIYLTEYKLNQLSKEGFDQMAGLKGQLEALLWEKNFARAEALLDFAENWASSVVSYISRGYDIEASLFIIGERKASKDFADNLKVLLKVGDFEGMDALFINMKKALKGREAVITAHTNKLFERTLTALVGILESMRTLAAISEPSTRAELAARVPPPSYIITGRGPNTSEKYRAFLKGQGVPLPGQIGVQAFGVDSLRGYFLPVKENVSGLRGKKDAPGTEEAAPEEKPAS